ncbi:sodium:solute symporter family protein [Lacimicrobium alkaliphilum]|uniref:Sodium:solute symporter n=1 Tax=Lacimicrobium alkaliphilum TaxID=1526571 RepID=A0A0U2JJP3_9ALTE|nr:sodium:solute symporter family protein [Lacimicrobium alkaliphilum]ALS99910.1 sodium:solute symporter [Lacimicrobium alkaliphilum]
MKIAAFDIAIILLYLSTIIGIGFYLKRRASENMRAYYQGGRKLPWYMLGLSNASGMFDISGTMWLVTLCFVYGMKSIWIPWLWPVFNQVVLMVYLSIWLRRSNVLTGAEWIRTRFGDGTGGKLSHMIVVVFAVISVLGFLAYGFVGVGKFIEIFVPWEAVSPYLPFELTPEYVPHFYGILFTSIATLYVMLGGMMSIVWADVLQFTIMTIAALAIGIIAMVQVSPEALQAATPQGWANPFFGWRLDLDWSGIIDEVNDKILSDGYSLFSIFVMMMLFKGILVSAAGPAPNYDMQKILATRSPREGALMSGFVSVALMPIRYFMIAGFTVLAVVYYDRLDLVSGGNLDFENILPGAILEFAPIGIMGLLLAGLIAAFMSTFASTVNAAPAYLVNDIYLRYINPQASNKVLIRASYFCSVAVVVISTVIGLYVQSINSVLQWLVSGLWGGYVVSNVLKWYWWRLNGLGYFWGMLAGIVCALLLPPLYRLLFPQMASDIVPLYVFPLMLLLSTVVCIATTLLTPPEDKELLKNFYRQVNPWGFWGPVRRQVEAENPDFIANANFKRDMFNILIGVITQTALVALPILIVIQQWQSGLTCLLVLVISALVLKKSWYDRLPD